MSDMEFYERNFDKIFEMIRADYYACRGKQLEEVADLVSSHYEIFEFIVYVMKKGLLSNKETEYCYCTVRQFEKIELVCTFNKTKNNYRIDVYEKVRSR